MKLTPSEYGHVLTWAPCNKYVRITAYNANTQLTVSVLAGKNTCYIPGGDFTDILIPELLNNTIITQQDLPVFFVETPALVANTNTGNGISKGITTLYAGNSYISEHFGMHKAEIVLAAPYLLVIDDTVIEANSPLRVLSNAKSIQVTPTVTSIGKFSDSLLSETEASSLEIIYV